MIDVLFVAWNRLEYTKTSLANLVETTNWGLVRRLIIHDDGSTDGTAEYLDGLYLAEKIGRTVTHANTKIGSPTGVMNCHIDRGAEFLAKVDNDAMMPPRWLDESLAVMDRHPELNLLGLGAWMPVGAGQRTYEVAKAIGGIGLMRTKAFECCLPWDGGRYGGAQMWQSDHMQEPVVLTGPITPERRVREPHRVSVSGWINPGIPVFLLDQMPGEKWNKLREEYEAMGWQRHWPTYPLEDKHLWEWCEAV